MIEAAPTDSNSRALKEWRLSFDDIVESSMQPLLTVAEVHLLAVMSPGPSFITVSRTAPSGRPTGLAVALACGLGVRSWTIGGILNIIIVFNQAPWLSAVLKAAGGFYLLHLAVIVWQHAASPIGVADGIQRKTLSQAFGQTFLTQISNPKVAVFFSAIFASVLPPDPSLCMIVAMLTIVSANETAWHSFVALGLSAARPRALYLRIKSVPDYAMAALPGTACVKLLTDAGRGV